MYRSFLLAAALACASFFGSPASAQITFTLNNVSLGVAVGQTTFGAGSLTGSFTTSGGPLTSTSTLMTWNISAPSTAPINGHAFAGFTYNPSNSSAFFNVGSSGLLSGFELDSPFGSTSSNQAESVRLYFTSNLSTSGPISLGSVASLPASYESEHLSGGNRLVQSGAVAAVPEPSSWIMGSLATLLFAGLCLRSSRRA